MYRPKRFDLWILIVGYCLPVRLVWNLEIQYWNFFFIGLFCISLPAHCLLNIAYCIFLSY